MTTTLSPYTLFGLTKPFLPPPWTTTDDRIRGGASQSHLTALPNNTARFYGHLDTSTLGGAGFASQFSPPETFTVASDSNSEERKDYWDLSAYDGIEIEVGKGDGKVYTFILKDQEQAEKREDGREKSGISWEVEFKAGSGSEEKVEKEGGTKVWVPWGDFKATYRGKEKEDAGNPKTGEVRRVGLMMRSYFGKQDGDFDLELKAITARKKPSSDEQQQQAIAGKVGEPAQKPVSDGKAEDSNRKSTETQSQEGILRWLSRKCRLS